jgi:hypothetical protein
MAKKYLGSVVADRQDKSSIGIRDQLPKAYRNATDYAALRGGYLS